jgi:hypothetical protein
MIECDDQENQGEYQFIFAGCRYLKQQIVLEPAQMSQAFNLHGVEQDMNVNFTISFTELQFLITGAQFSICDVTDKSYWGTQIQLVPQQGSAPHPPLGHNLSLTKDTMGVRRFRILLCHDHIHYQSSSSKQLTPDNTAHLHQLHEQMPSTSHSSTPILTHCDSNLCQPTTRGGSVSHAAGDHPFCGNGIVSHIVYVFFNDSHVCRTAHNISWVSQSIDNIFDDDNDIVYCAHRILTPIEPQEENEEMYDNGDFYNNDASNNEQEEFDEDNNHGHSQSPQVGQKRTWSPMCTPDGMTCKAIKVQEGKGKLKAEDWELTVQDIIPEAILLYENKLVLETPYPDHMQEMVWAKATWQNGCHECGVKIHHNGKLLKIACSCYIL